jgi:DNA end-binding protein Ku
MLTALGGCKENALAPLSRHSIAVYRFLSLRRLAGRNYRTMAQRPIWRGHLRLALVSCSVALVSAKRDRGSIGFHLINPETGNRIRLITQDAGTGNEVSRSNLVKGYEFKKNTYVLLNDEDLENVKVESSSLMTIEKFVDAGSIDPIYYDASFYLAPEGNASLDVYAVLREAIEETGRVALSRVVIAQRERTIAVRPFKGGLVAHTLYEERDINDARPVFQRVATVRTDPALVQLAKQLIERQTGSYDPSDLEDRYETRLRAMIDAKLNGERIEEEGEPDRGNVIDLMAALRKSLGQTTEASPPKATPTRSLPAKRSTRRTPATKPAAQPPQAPKSARK